MAVEYKDYYQTLGLPRTAGEEEIRKAFRKLARQYHPDVAKHKPNAEERFKEINEAYEVLGDPEKRKKYDNLGPDWNAFGHGRPPSGADSRRSSSFTASGAPGESFEFHFGGTGFSDFFEQMFGSRTGFKGFSAFGDADDLEEMRRGGRAPPQGGHVESDLLVTLQEALQGSVRTVSLRRVNPQTGVSETRSFRVKIPAGVQDGQRIRVPGKGEDSVAGGKPGDLYLRVNFAKHPDFRVQGNDLRYELELAPWEAVLGTTAEIPTLEGSVSLKIHPGTPAGQKLRLRGKGLPTRNGLRGDLYVAVTIQIPTEVAAQDKELWQQLAARSSFHPRK